MGHDEATTADSLPLQGFILCATSISHDVRADITQKGTEMGAVWKQDLTSDATHLIVGDVTTPKYRYVAKQRPDVKPMHINFIEKTHEAWVAGDKISISQLESDNVFPPFTGFRICLTNINEEEERHVIQKDAERNGAIYSGDLTKQVTHLIAARPDGKKYSYAKQWNIKVVCLDWFYQSLERGMSLDEALFSFEVPEEDRGRGAWIRPTIGKRKLSEREDSNKGDGRTKSDPAKRKIKRAASDRLSSGSQSLWGDIIGQGKAPKLDKPSEWGSDAPQRPQAKDQNVPPEAQQPDMPYVNVNASVSMTDLLPPKPKKMFHGVSFHVHSFAAAREEKLREILRSYDGNTYASMQELFEASSNRYIIIVPDTFAQSDCPRVSDASRAVQIVSAWWLERCLHEEKFIEPDEYTLGRPMKQRNIAAFEGLTISVTKFDGVDYLHVTKTIRALGAEFCEGLSKSRSLLLVNTKDQSDQQDKRSAAREWKIPMVSEAWLMECVTEGEFIPYKRFLLGPAQNQAPNEEDSTVKMEPVSDALNGCNVKFDTDVKEDLAKLRQAVNLLSGVVVPTADDETPLTHFITLAKNPKRPSSRLKKAWDLPDCLVVSEFWLKKSMKHKTRFNERRYLILKDGSLPAMTEDVQDEDKEAPLIDERFDIPTLGENSGNPFTIEEIEIQPDLDDTLNRLVPLAISPPSKNQTGSESSNSHVNKPSRTPSKIMPLRTPSKNSPFKTMKLGLPKPLAIDNAKGNAMLQNNLTEILKLAKQENKPAHVPKRPPRKFQGRALSNENSLGSGPNSLSRGNSLNSNVSASKGISDSGESNSLSRTNSLSNNLDLGESMLYDSNYESIPQQEFDTQPSQAIHYVDTDAQAEKKKLFEKLALTDDGGVMKGRTIVQSTVAAEEIGGPLLRRTTRKVAH